MNRHAALVFGTLVATAACGGIQPGRRHDARSGDDDASLPVSVAARRRDSRVQRAPGGPVYSKVDVGDYPGTASVVTGPKAVRFHPNGRFLYIGESIDVSQRVGPIQADNVSGGSLIAGYRIDPETGALAPLPGSPISLTFPKRHLHIGTLDIPPSGRFLYAGASGAGTCPHVLGYRIDVETGSLTPLDQPAFTFPRPGYY